MQFENCLSCPLIQEQRCSGPKFMRAPTKDLVEWLFAYLKLHGITNAQLAVASNVPKGTIDGLKNRTDVRHETFLPLLKAAIEMTGGVWDLASCPLAHADNNTVELRQEVIRLTEELKREKDVHALSTRLVKERTRAVYALFGLCAGLVLLLVILLLKWHL